MVSGDRVQEYEKRIQSMSSTRATKQIERNGDRKVKEFETKICERHEKQTEELNCVRREWRVKK